MSDGSQAVVVDTYAEAFRSVFAEVLVSAANLRWLNHAANAATGNASSTILCDCEAGVDRYGGPGTEHLPGHDPALHSPDGRPCAVLQFHVPAFKKNATELLERVLLVRLSQNILTCPTARCFGWTDSPDYFRMGRKISFFGDKHEYRDRRFDRDVWIIPIMSGEFVMDRRFPWRKGIMGGNLWFLAENEDAAVEAAERGMVGVDRSHGVIAPFPGGVAASASKAGSQYKFLFASTYEKYCPSLREKLGEASGVPEGVNSITEIVINGPDLETISRSMQAAIAESRTTPGLRFISAGNYNGRLGKNFIYLLPEAERGVAQNA
jgi:formylmethanofuran--tetrahydromethanopterin N-formyltransferase